MRTFGLVVMLMLAASGAVLSKDMTAISPSFNCAKASAEDEQTICGSRKLAELDRLLANAYATLQAKAGKAMARKIATPLLKKRHACASNIDCIYRAQREFGKAIVTAGVQVTLPAWSDQSA